MFRTNSKYPNADTSPERLTELQTAYAKAVTLCSDEEIFLQGDIVRDLLAMLEEHTQAQNVSVINSAEGIQALQDELMELRQQLHDQRWRRLVDCEEEFDANAVQWSSCHNYWRPILPLPKE